VNLGLVSSLNQPGSNVTGVSFFGGQLGPKQVELVHELIPAAVHVGLLVNPNFPATDAMTRDVTTAASAIGLQIDVMKASDSRDIEAAFGALVRNKADALLVTADPFLAGRRLQIATLAARHAIPTVYPLPEFADAGGLVSYGNSVTEAYRQAGIYTGKILKGATPADLPVMRSTKFELVINLPTAHAIGLEIPASVLARADKVIE
jgi:putative ABC transport system substrate-binding protein